MEFVCKTINQENTLLVNWNCSDKCNLDCSYCFLKNIDGLNYKFPSLDDSLKVVDWIYEQEAENYFITFFSGEPTLYSKFLDILRYINDKGKNTKIEIVTNFTREAKYFKKMFDMFGDNLNLVLSYHRESANVDTWIEKLKELDGRIITIFYLTTELDENWYKLNSINFKTIKIRPKLIRSSEEEILSNKEVKAEVNKFESKNFILNNKAYSSDEILANSLNNFYMWKCDAGVKSFYIDPNFDVWACMKLKLKNIKLGNILEKNVKVLKSMRCLFDYCHCCDFNSKKWK